MGIIDLKAGDRILRLRYSPVSSESLSQWCELYLVADNMETRLAADILDEFLPKLVIGFMDRKDRNFHCRQNMELFTITPLQDAHSELMGRITESGDLELIHEGSYGEITRLMTLTEEDKVQWIQAIFEHLARDVFREPEKH